MSSCRVVLTFLFFSLLTAHGQWRTESFSLPQGWSALYLPVDPEHSIDSLVADHPEVTELWEWSPQNLDQRVLDDPESPVSSVEWKVWKRGDLANSTLAYLQANQAYLVHMSSAATLSIKGAVVTPVVRWRTDGLNLLGFSTSATAPPTMEAFFSPAEVVDDSTEIYGYKGGRLVDGTNPEKLTARNARVERHKAYWLRANQYADYEGPLRVKMALGDRVDFGSALATQTVFLTNRSNRDLTVTLTPTASEAEPGTTTAPNTVPLTLRETDDAGQVTFVSLVANHVVTVPAEGSLRVILGVDRTQLVGAAGEASHSLLRVTESGGHADMHLPVSATVASMQGLWVGQAEITHVQTQVADGSSNALEEVSRVFPLRVIVHVDAAGQARLLSQAYHGAVDTDAEGVSIYGVSTKESGLLAQKLSRAKRYSAAHLPRSTAKSLTGSLGAGENLVASLRIAHDAPDNPFIHTYHPDHDNLDSRFENPLPAGIESHEIVRAITLEVDAAAPSTITDPAWGTTLLTGTYKETLSGLHRAALSTSGVFALSRVSSATTFVSQ